MTVEHVYHCTTDIVKELEINILIIYSECHKNIIDIDIKLT